MIVFSDSISNFDGNAKFKINQNIINGRARFWNSPGVTSGEILHYLDPILFESRYETAVVHVDINDIHNDTSSTKIEKLVVNYERIIMKLRKYSIRNVCFFCSFSFTTFDNWDCYYIKELTFPHEFFCVYPIFHWGNIIKKNVGKSEGFREKKGFLI